MDDNILLLIEGEILEDLNSTDIPYSVLPFWIWRRDTKATVSEKEWIKFETKKIQELQNLSKENKGAYFGMLRGMINPIKDNYEDPIQGTKDIANRHYATLKYFIVRDPSRYKNQNLKINNSIILTIKEFYALLKVREPDLIKEYNQRNVHV